MSLPGWLRFEGKLNVVLLGVHEGTAWLHTYAGELRRPIVFWVDLVRGRVLGETPYEAAAAPSRAVSYDGGVLIETKNRVTAVGKDGIRWSVAAKHWYAVHPGAVVLQEGQDTTIRDPMDGTLLGTLPNPLRTTDHQRWVVRHGAPFVRPGTYPGGVHYEDACSIVVSGGAIQRLTSRHREVIDGAGAVIAQSARSSTVALHPSDKGVVVEVYAGPGRTRFEGAYGTLEFAGERLDVLFAHGRGILKVRQGEHIRVLFFEGSDILARVRVREGFPIHLAADERTLVALWAGGVAWFTDQLYAVRLPDGYGRVALWDGFPIVSLLDRLIPVSPDPIPQWLPEGGTPGDPVVLLPL